MARTTRSETARRSRTSARTNRGMYVDGNTVRRLAEVPERKRQPGRQNPGRQQINRNRRVQASPAQWLVGSSRRRMSGLPNSACARRTLTFWLPVRSAIWE